MAFCLFVVVVVAFFAGHLSKFPAWCLAFFAFVQIKSILRQEIFFICNRSVNNLLESEWLLLLLLFYYYYYYYYYYHYSYYYQLQLWLLL